MIPQPRRIRITGLRFFTSMLTTKLAINFYTPLHLAVAGFHGPHVDPPGEADLLCTPAKGGVCKLQFSWSLRNRLKHLHISAFFVAFPAANRREWTIIARGVSEAAPCRTTVRLLQASWTRRGPGQVGRCQRAVRHESPFRLGKLHRVSFALIH